MIPPAGMAMLKALGLTILVLALMVGLILPPFLNLLWSIMCACGIVWVWKR